MRRESEQKCQVKEKKKVTRETDKEKNQNKKNKMQKEKTKEYRENKKERHTSTKQMKKVKIASYKRVRTKKEKNCLAEDK